MLKTIGIIVVFCAMASAEDHPAGSTTVRSWDFSASHGPEQVPWPKGATAPDLMFEVEVRGPVKIQSEKAVRPQAPGRQ